MPLNDKRLLGEFFGDEDRKLFLATVGEMVERFGVRVMEENVVSAAGTTFRLNETTMQRLIRELGYEPHRRNNWYQRLD